MPEANHALSASPTCPMDRSWLMFLEEEEKILQLFPIHVLKHIL
jgi:hypothetical protein